MSSHKRKPPRVIFVKSAQTLPDNEVENTTKVLTVETVTVHPEARALSDKNELEAAQPGEKVMDNSKAVQSGAEVMDNSKAAKPGAEVMGSSKTAQSGAEVMNNSKAAQSGAEVMDNSKAAQSGAEVMNNSKAAQSGAEVMGSSKTAQSGAEVMNNSKAAQSGAEVMDNSKAAQPGTKVMGSSKAAQPGAKVMDSNKAAQPEAEEINFDDATQAKAEKINNSEATKSGAEKINVDVADSQSLEILTLLEEINIQVEDNPGPKMRVMWQNDCNDDDKCYQMSLASHMPEIGNANRRGKATTGIRMLQEISQERKLDIGIKERTKKSVMYRWFRQPKKTKVKKFKPEKTTNEKKKENGTTKFNLVPPKKTKNEKKSEKANTKFKLFGQPKKTRVKAFKEDTKPSKENNEENGQTKLDQIRNFIRQSVSRLQNAFSCRQI